MGNGLKALFLAIALAAPVSVSADEDDAATGLTALMTAYEARGWRGCRTFEHRLWRHVHGRIDLAPVGFDRCSLHD